MGRPDEENAAVGKTIGVFGKADTEGGDFRQMKMEVEEGTVFSDEEEEPIGAGGERSVEMTVGEFGG